MTTRTHCWLRHPPVSLLVFSGIVSNSTLCQGGSTTTTASTTTTVTSTSSGDDVSTPSPIRTGMISTCDEFYLVASGDTCVALAGAAGISLATFYAWNPPVGSSCATLEVANMSVLNHWIYNYCRYEHSYYRYNIRRWH
jgi:hypothetical protein